MKQLLTKIEGLEKSIKLVVDRISSLKEENQILSEENNRLHRELNQLRKSSGAGSLYSGPDVVEEINLSERDINVVQVKTELDRCIEEIEECLSQL